MVKLKSITRKGKKRGKVTVEFEVPMSLVNMLDNQELVTAQKIELVKTYTDLLTDKSGKKLLSETIPTQIAVIMIMVLEAQEHEEESAS